MLTNFQNKVIQRKIEISNTIIQCLRKMDEEHTKLLFVFNNDCFVGILTIGDIQRAIINNINLTEQVGTIIDVNKIYAKTSDDFESIKTMMLHCRIECMPVIDENGSLKEVYFWEEVFPDTQIEKKEKINIPVVIMAGGKGLRLKPLTNIIPKALIPVGEKTILEIILNQFEGIGCSKFFVSVNYKAEILQYYLNSLDKKYDIHFFKEDKPLGTIGSVSLLKEKIDTPFFVSNCDIIIDQDFRDVYSYHCNNKNDITVVSAVKGHQIPYGVIETSEDGIITGISEKPEITYLINTGVYILQPHLINEIPENQLFHITNLIDQIKYTGGRVGSFPISENSWTDIGDWKEYNKIILNIK